MTNDDEPEPQDPHEAGVAEQRPRQMQEEAAHQLGAQARDRLSDQGFERDQVFAWAEAYVAEHGATDVAQFIEWIETEQS